ncbi:MAG TPA: hydrogenase maturation protease [Gammaproteobacteria bacterium]|nr:hydrogenase maturation protease [Gammaproteobacteria bacterium]
MPAQQGRTLVLGIGNLLLGDDGAGLHVLESLSRDPRVPADADLVDGGTLSFTLLPLLEDAAAWIVIDAARLDAPPGTVRVMQGTVMDRFVARPGGVSVHEVSLAELMDMARLGGGVPRRRAFVAIQPQRVDWGERPGPAVQAGVARAREAVLGLLGEWSR